MEPLLAIFDRAMTIECQTRHLYEESRIWFRFNERERAEKRDGLSLPAVGHCRSKLASAGVVSEAR